MRIRYFLLILYAVGFPASLPGQETIVVLPPANGAAPGMGFSGFGSAPISPTAVLHSYMQSSDSGAVLGFAAAIRGPQGWYDTRVAFGEMGTDSLPPGAVGQWWRVGAMSYRFVYDPAKRMLAVLDTLVDLSESRVVLITLPAVGGGKPTIQLGEPVDLAMRRPEPIAPRFLAVAPQVRVFADVAP